MTEDTLYFRLKTWQVLACTERAKGLKKKSPHKLNGELSYPCHPAWGWLRGPAASLISSLPLPWQVAAALPPPHCAVVGGCCLGQGAVAVLLPWEHPALMLRS